MLNLNQNVFTNLIQTIKSNLQRIQNQNKKGIISKLHNTFHLIISTIIILYFFRSVSMPYLLLNLINNLNMSLRAVQEFVIHIQSFRNIDLWYQGAYMLRIQLYFQHGNQQPKQRIYAHPFAHTQQYSLEQQQQTDPQIIKEAAVHPTTSSFLSRCFLLRYYEEEVQINDIVHFRVQSAISLDDHEIVMEVGLLFFDQQIKKVDPDQVTLEKAKNPKNKRFIFRNSKAGVHQFLPLVFDGQYFSLANFTLHSVCLDYRFRVCPLQLYQFSRLSQAEKRKLLDKNRKIQPKQPNYVESLATALKIEGTALLPTVEEIVIRRMKQAYECLLKEYRHLFSRAITESHKQMFGHILVHPNQLSLFEDDFNSKGTQQERLFKRYRSRNSNQVIESMLNQTNLISGELLKLWHHYIDLIRISPRFATAHLEDLYYQTQQRQWQKLRRVYSISQQDIAIAPEGIDLDHEGLEKQLFAERAKLISQNNIVSEEFENKKNNICLMIQDSYQSEKKIELTEESQKVSLHLVVLVHGFQGNSLDMKLIKNNLSLLYPEVSFLCASSNEQMTDTDIIEMGNRLANEVKNHINEFFPPGSLENISFIGHSLGGVIIRAALPRLLDLKHKFHTLITFSSPHLGYKVNTSSVIQAGIWVLQKFKNSNCLKQLTMSDNANPKETCLYRISKFEGLKHFKNIFLFSSKQDSYAPYESARIEIHPDFMNAKDPLKQIHCEMVQNILEEVGCQKLRRIRVNFTIQQTNLDSIIGRTAHILFLQNNQLVQMFLHTHPDIFS